MGYGKLDYRVLNNCLPVCLSNGTGFLTWLARSFPRHYGNYRVSGCGDSQQQESFVKALCGADLYVYMNRGLRRYQTHSCYTKSISTLQSTKARNTILTVFQSPHSHRSISASVGTTTCIQKKTCPSLSHLSSVDRQSTLVPLSLPYYNLNMKVRLLSRRTYFFYNLGSRISLCQ